jgi:hypothetical protein
MEKQNDPIVETTSSTFKANSYTYETTSSTFEGISSQVCQDMKEILGQVCYPVKIRCGKIEVKIPSKLRNFRP